MPDRLPTTRDAAGPVGRSVAGSNRFDDLRSGRAWQFADVCEVFLAYDACDVLAVLGAVDDACARGRWAHGYVGYEAAPAFDPNLAVVGAEDHARPPLAWFAIGGPPRQVRPVRAPAAEDAGFRTQDWSPTWQADRYAEQVRLLQAMIAAGQTYQGNLTVALQSRVQGDLTQFYAQLAHRQRGSYAAYLDIGTHVVASASPELFYERVGDQVRMRPMKGTAARGRTAAEDELAVRGLVGSVKERAENIMILDLLRNDLGRIADIGAVRVTSICEPERYETVWQLASEVRATVPAATSTLDVFRSLFPSGSVTGAPKVATMRILAELESVPRGPYCGAIGFVGPRKEGSSRERFNVAIRTVVIDKSSGAARYGTGSAITWDSTVEAEHNELLVKARILNGAHQDFELFETMAHVAGAGVRNLDRHLARMASSAGYFGFAFEQAAVRGARGAAVAGAAHARVRVSLCRDGAITVQLGPMPAPDAGPVSLRIDPAPIDSAQPWFFHKTTRRGAYLERAARHPGADDVVLVNERGEVTETTIANIAVRNGATWCTPPIESGCLPGVGRAVLVESGDLLERQISVAELLTADAVAVVSSLRGWRPAVLVAG